MAHLRRDQVKVVFAKHILFRFVSENTHCGWVGIGDTSIAVHPVDHVTGVFHDLAEARLAFLQLTFCLFAVGDIADGDHPADQ